MRQGAFRNTAGIGLDKAGVELTDRGYVKVNERLEMSAPEVSVLGDCAGSPLFTHISEDDFLIVRAPGRSGRTHVWFVPYCMFTDPPLAHVGLKRARAVRLGVKTRVAKLPMSAVLRCSDPASQAS